MRAPASKPAAPPASWSTSVDNEHETLMVKYVFPGDKGSRTPSLVVSASVCWDLTSKECRFFTLRSCSSTLLCSHRAKLNSFHSSHTTITWILTGFIRNSTRAESPLVCEVFLWSNVVTSCLCCERHTILEPVFRPFRANSWCRHCVKKRSEAPTKTAGRSTWT